MKLRQALSILALSLAALGLSACGGMASSNSMTEKPKEAKPAATMEQKTPEAKTSATARPAKYRKIAPEKAKEIMDKNPKAIILDVRTKGEYDEGHIKNAILIPNETIDTQPPKELPDKNAEILVYCRSGNRSRQAAEKLVKMGYTKVRDFGGVNTWTYGLVK